MQPYESTYPEVNIESTTQNGIPPVEGTLDP